MANKIEDRLVSEWADDEKRTLLDLATGGRFKTSEDLPSLLGLAKRAYGALKASGEKQQEELNKPMIASVGGREIDLGITQGQLHFLTLGSIGDGPKSQASYLLRRIQDIRRGQKAEEIGSILKLRDQMRLWFKNKKFDEVAKKAGIKFSPERRSVPGEFKPWSGGRKVEGGKRGTDPSKVEDWEW